MRTTALMICLLLPASSWAAFEDQGAGGRAPGMGDAFTAIADDVYAIHYNPAGLAQLRRSELGASYSQLFIGLTDASTLSHTFVGFAQPLKTPRLGAVGVAWEQFALNGSYYQEHTFTASYSRLLAEHLWIGSLYGGVNAKMLYRSLGSYGEAANATNGLFATGLADPVLARKGGLWRPDADLGFLYKMRDHYSVGVDFTHLLQPNIAFGAGAQDRLPMSMRLGLNYSSLISNAGIQYETRQSALGTQDQIFTLALERWFRMLMIGDFGVRGALSEGSRGYTSLAAGVSYRSQRFGVDYAFSMPINSVVSTAGSHRVSLQVRFGSPSEPDESVVMILDAMRQLQKGTVPELQVLGLGLAPGQRAVLEENIALAKSLESQAKYRDALERLGKAIAVSPSDTDLLKSYGRLNWVGQQIKELSDYRGDPVQAAWHQGILAYLGFRDDAAMERCSYAFSLDPQNKALDGFLAQLELATGVRRPAVSPDAVKRYQIEKWLAQAAVHMEEGEYDQAIFLSRQVLSEEPLNQKAWENLGTSYFAIGDYDNSLKAWETALSLEKDPARRTVINGYIKSLKAILARRAAKPKLKAEENAAPLLSPQEVQKLYNQGVDDYTSGRLERAKAAFEEVLKSDPAYVPAQKALKRVTEEQQGR